MTGRSRFVVTAAAIVGLLIPLAACGSDNSGKPSTTTGVQTPLSNQVTSTSFVGGQPAPAGATNGGGNPGTGAAGGG